MSSVMEVIYKVMEVIYKAAVHSGLLDARLVRVNRRHYLGFGRPCIDVATHTPSNLLTVTSWPKSDDACEAECPYCRQKLSVQVTVREPGEDWVGVLLASEEEI